MIRITDYPVVLSFFPQPPQSYFDENIAGKRENFRLVLSSFM
jgi:hypothetical protein